MKSNPYLKREVYLVKEEKKGKINYRKINGKTDLDKWLLLVRNHQVKGQIVSIEEETIEVHNKMIGLF